MITEQEVLDAYLKQLRLRRRAIKADESLVCETPAQGEERLTAFWYHDTLELQYLAQEAM